MGYDHDLYTTILNNIRADNIEFFARMISIGAYLKIPDPCLTQNLPKGAIRLTRREVIEAAYRYRDRKEFRAYRKLENVWPAVGGFACMLTSCYVISIVRHKFKLGMDLTVGPTDRQSCRDAMTHL